MPKYKNNLLRNIIKGRYSTIKWNEFQEYIYKTPNKHHRFLLFISYITGLRPVEAKNIMRKDISFSKSYIEINIPTAKRGSNRIIWIPISSQIAKEFKQYVMSMAFPKEYVFGRFASVRNIRDKFIKDNLKYYIGKYDENNNTFYPFSFYVLRHNILTLLAENGADFIDLHLFKGARLSQSLFGSVSYYIHHSQERMKKISKILRKIMKI